MQQLNAYNQLVAGLRAIGFQGALLEERYGFCDWFTPTCEKRTILAAAFGQTPVAYDSALIGIAQANGLREQSLVNQYRSLGAPIILEIDSTEIREWAVSHSANNHELVNRFPLSRVRDLLTSRASDWKPDAFLRAKNIGEFRWLRQLDLFAGLVPELEGQIQSKLEPLLHETLSATKHAYRDETGREPDEAKLFKLIFWILTAKVFRDRRVPGFTTLGHDSDHILQTIAKHYKADVPQLLTKSARQVAANRIWADLDFRNLSVEVLSHIWSTALIDPDIRLRLGIYRTSRTIVRYIVERVPLEASGDDELIILEPCSGSAVFLVGAMNLLRQKWFGMQPSSRHEYFTEHLAAIERDPFGVEISTLALTLADFPNPNGWDVRRGDVFKSGVLAQDLKRAGVVFCNPPFGAFDDDERAEYQLTSAKKPVELLNRVLDDLHPRGVIGFVLPRLFLDGHGYAKVRKRLAERFASLHVMVLPDRAFTADVEVALLIATEPIPHVQCRVVTRKVNDTADAWHKFEIRHDVSHEYTADLSALQVESGLPMPDLPEVWAFLSDYPSLSDHAELHRGLEWNEPLTVRNIETGNRRKFVRQAPHEGFMRGVAPRESFNLYQVPQMSYLSMKPADQRVSAWRHEWDKPKAILNKAARSRGPWRLSAFPDSEGVTCYQTFIGVWPTSDRYDEWLLSAILNSPVANAFVAAREGKTDVTVETLRAIPVPRFTSSQAQDIRRLIVRYQAVAQPELMGGGSDGVCERLLKELDALVLSAYRMPPRLERALLDFFEGCQRPTSHRFTRYFPVDCDVYFSLADYMSPEFAAATVGNLLNGRENL